MHELSNGTISIQVADFGAELKSLKMLGKEYLWNADPKFWKRSSPVLFPIVGSLKNGEYSYKGKTYPMGQHGFARDMEFVCKEQTDAKIVLELKSNEETLKKYPFAFTLRIEYELEGNHLIVRWRVSNDGNERMFFSIGAHPAFLCPLREGEKQTDYLIQMDTNRVISGIIGDGGLLGKETKKFELSGGMMAITEHLFDQDALIIEGDQAHQVALVTPDHRPYISLKFNAPLFGIWSPAGKQAPFICIEPWYGRCDSEEFEGELQDRQWGNDLDVGKEFRASYVMTLFSV